MTHVVDFSNSFKSKPKPWLPSGPSKAAWKDFFISDKGIKSCGRFGPDRFESTSDKSISMTFEYTASTSGL